MYENDIAHLRRIINSLRALPADNMISVGTLRNVLESLCTVLSALCDEQEHSLDDAER